MPCFTRMKRFFLQGLLWLHLIGFGVMALSLEPGFLDFDNLPDTNFSCVGKVIGGYYADLETNCQMFHVCTIGQLDEPMDIRFLCLNGTVFDQETRVCERIDEVDCSKSEQFYSLNLELYGNTQPPILEESPETDAPLIIKKTPTTTTTTSTSTTPRPRPSTTKHTPKPTRPHYFTTPTPPSVTTLSNPKVISSHHFPLIHTNSHQQQQINSNSPDIRFNPEEINISLNPGAPPNIRTKPHSYHQHDNSYSDNSHSNNKKVIVTTHSNLYKNNNNNNNDKAERISLLTNNNNIRHQVTSTTQHPKQIINYVKNPTQSVTPSDINYGFTYRPNENQGQDNSDYQTENPSGNYHYEANYANLRPPNIHGHAFLNRDLLKTSTYRADFTPTTRKYFFHNKPLTTFRSSQFFTSLKPSQHYNFQRTEKPPQRVQLPLPLLPTLSPLTFSTPAPFSLSRHIETKRYTNNHQAPPRIIISASASVSDGTGRKLNYSLGTIGTAHLLEQPPSSYDEYKDDDVGLDPFYHDVPKVDNAREKRSRKKRNAANVKPSDVIKTEQEAVDVLKFLFDWYKDHEKQATTITIPVTPDIITQINDELDGKTKIDITSEENKSLEDKTEEQKSISLEEDFKESALFKRKSKFNIVGDVVSVTEEGSTELHNTKEDSESNVLPVKIETTKEWHDYVDDNYEPLTYKETPNASEANANDTPSSEDAQISRGHYITKVNVETTTKADVVPHLTITENEQQPEITENFNQTVDHQISEPTNSQNHSNNDTELEKERRIYHTEQSVITLIQSEESTRVSHPKRNKSRGRGGKKFALNDNVNTNHLRNQRRRKRISTTTSTTTTTELPPLETITFETTTEKLHHEDLKIITTPTNEAQFSEASTDEKYSSILKEEDQSLSEASVSSTELPISHSNHSVELTTESTPIILEAISDEKYSSLLHFEDSTPIQNNPRIKSRSSTTTEEPHLEESYNTNSNQDDQNFEITTTTTTTEAPSILEFINDDQYSSILIEDFTPKENPSSRSSSSSTEAPLDEIAITTTTTTTEAAPIIEPINVDRYIVLEDSTPKRNSRIRSRSSTTTTTTTTTEAPHVEEELAITTTTKTIETPLISEPINDDHDQYSSILLEASLKRNPRVRSRSSTTTTTTTERPFAEEETTVTTTEIPLILEPINDDQYSSILLEDSSPLQNSRSTTETPRVEEEIVITTTTKKPLVLESNNDDHDQYSSTLLEDSSPKHNSRIRSRNRSSTSTTTTTTVETPLEKEEIIANPTTSTTETPSIFEPINDDQDQYISNLFDDSIANQNSTTTTEAPLVKEEETVITTTSTTEAAPKITVDEYSSSYLEDSTPKRNPRIRSRSSTTSTTESQFLDEVFATTTTTTSETPSMSESIIDTNNPNVKPVLENSTPKRNPRIRSRTSTTTEAPPLAETYNPNSDQEIATITSTTTETAPPIKQVKNSRKRHQRIRSRSSTTTTEPPINFENLPAEYTTINKKEVEAPFIKSGGIEYIGILKPDDQVEHISSTQSSSTASIEITTQIPHSSENYQETILSTATPKTTIPEEAKINLEHTTKSINNFETTSENKKISITEKIDDLDNTEIEYIQTVSSENLAAGKSKFNYNSDKIEYIHTLPKENVLLYDSDGRSFKFQDDKEIAPPRIKINNNEIDQINLESGTIKDEPMSTTTEKEITTNSEEYTKESYQTSLEPLTENLGNVETTISPEHSSVMSTQMQKFIEKIESNTNSVAAVKITTTDSNPTTLPTTVKSIEYTTILQQFESTDKPNVTTGRTRSSSRYNRYNNLRSKPNNNSQRNRSRHRFSTEQFTPKSEQYEQTDQPTQKLVKNINLISNSELKDVNIVNITTQQSVEEENKSSITAHQDVEYTEDVPSTDPPFYKSANPTQESQPKESLETTPLSKVYKVQVKKAKVNKNFIFNCFGKEINKFYSDPRDCRLFHYCTRGYNKNQLLDMKFVCDLSTYFDEDKLICTKRKPLRCL